MKILIEESVLRQALGALETEANIYIDNDPEDGPPESMAEAITALRTALDDAEKVEPVAWLYKDTYGKLKVSQIEEHDEHGFPVFTHPAPAVPEKVESPDREEFERQAKYQGITDFSLNQNGFRTYANDVAEFAWRLWANKNSPVYKSMLSAAPTPPIALAKLGADKIGEK